MGGTPEIKRYLYPLFPLGDRVSIAALKIYSAEELTKPENADAYLTVARNAFSERGSVLEKPDTDPKVTLFVLEFLKEKEVSSPGIEKRIAYLQGCVRDFTCSSQGGYNFFHKSSSSNLMVPAEFPSMALGTAKTLEQKIRQPTARGHFEGQLAGLAS